MAPKRTTESGEDTGNTTVIEETIPPITEEHDDTIGIGERLDANNKVLRQVKKTLDQVNTYLTESKKNPWVSGAITGLKVLGVAGVSLVSFRVGVNVGSKKAAEQFEQAGQVAGDFVNRIADSSRAEVAGR